MKPSIPRQRELLHYNEDDHIDPYTKKLKVIQMRFWTANRPENLSVFSLRVQEHFPGTKFDSLELCYGNTTVNVNRYFSSTFTDKYIQPRDIVWKMERNVLTLQQGNHFGNIEQFFDLVSSQFRCVSFSSMDIIPGFRCLEVINYAR